MGELPVPTKPALLNGSSHAQVKRVIFTPGRRTRTSSIKASGCAPLKRHNGESDNIGIKFADESGNSLANLALNQDQVSHSHAVMWIHVPANDVSAPLGIRMPTGGMCSNESGMESNRTFIRTCPYAPMRIPQARVERNRAKRAGAILLQRAPEKL